ncbi:MAG: UDP-glucose 6-dehydrogenase [Legionellaceae bacterium]|nr:UDP-glucose 6-dehydrogenase [Legionellaceae bacterium]|tara:strand:+ start:605 stop:1939 length:1335 start_codon:yes stop_codon:yes gene_type:complete
MNITVVGTGYVGLVTGACLAEVGNHVTCVDVDQDKISRLNAGEIPIYEPGLEVLVKENIEAGRLSFVTSLSAQEKHGDIFFIAVGTPSDEDGSADLKYVEKVAEQIGQYLFQYAIVIDKSTVPVYTAEKVRDIIQSQLKARGKAVEFDVVSNPEFLKEGAAVEDFMQPDRVVVGVDSDRARGIMRELYAPFTRNPEQLLLMGIRDAEMTKYVSNAMLATRISFMNEIAVLCEQMGVDVENVRVGIGSDRRIGYPFLYPGCGYGGSCFPKDVKALVHMAESHDVKPYILHAVEERNALQKQILFTKLRAKFGDDLRDKKVALWGLSFKPDTDDMREASSVVFLEAAMKAGVNVAAYDPVAMTVAKRDLPAAWFESGQLSFVDRQMDALKDADALVLVTEWKPFRFPDFAQMKKLMRGLFIIDGRNQYDPKQVKAAGFEYSGIGRS